LVYFVVHLSFLKTYRVITKIYNLSDYLFKQLISVNTLKKVCLIIGEKDRLFFQEKYRAWGNSAYKEKMGRFFL